MQRRAGQALANRHPQATCSQLNNREGNLFSAQQRKTTSHIKLRSPPPPPRRVLTVAATLGETRIALTRLLSALLIKKTLNLNRFAPLLLLFSHHPDPSLMREKALQKMKSVVPERPRGQSVNFLIKDQHKSNFLFLSAVFQAEQTIQVSSPSLPPSFLCPFVPPCFSADPQLLSYEVCDKLFFFFCLKARSHFVEKQVPLLWPYPR